VSVLNESWERSLIEVALEETVAEKSQNSIDKLNANIQHG
jgi:hypothetical protein